MSAPELELRALRFYSAILAGPRTPRSDEYKEGVLAWLMHRYAGQDIVCPYTPPSSKFDAFYAGLEEGKSVRSAAECAGCTQFLWTCLREANVCEKFREEEEEWQQ